jgi:hypothetical protein
MRKPAVAGGGETVSGIAVNHEAGPLRIFGKEEEEFLTESGLTCQYLMLIMVSKVLPKSVSLIVQSRVCCRIQNRVCFDVVVADPPSSTSRKPR